MSIFCPLRNCESELHDAFEEEECLSCQPLLSYHSATKDFSLLHSCGSSTFHQQWSQLRNIQNSIMWFSFTLIMAFLPNSIRLHFCNLQFTIFTFATAICSLYLHVKTIKHCLTQLSLITSGEPKIISPWQERIPWDMPRKDFSVAMFV